MISGTQIKGVLKQIDRDVEIEVSSVSLATDKLCSRDSPWGRDPRRVQSGLWIGRDPYCSAPCGIAREDDVRHPTLVLMHPYHGM
jgi:hypothetical protein